MWVRIYSQLHVTIACHSIVYLSAGGLMWHSLHFFFSGPAFCPPATVYSWQPVQRLWNAVLVLGEVSLDLCWWQSWQAFTAVSVGSILWWHVVHWVMLSPACFLWANVTMPILVSNWMTSLSSGIVNSSATALLANNASKVIIKIFICTILKFTSLVSKIHL